MAFPPSPTILMVRKLPIDLSNEEASDLLQYFGAKSVSVMSPRGHMRGTAFAEFGSREEADIALKKLHQAPLFGSRLVVQYSEKNFMPFEAPDSVILPQPPKATEKPPQPERVGLKTESLPDHSLHYLYPPPTSQTLSNISHALVAVPHFYIQVLHLMNKMNLPPPFSKSTEKSIFETSASLPPPLPSSSESELESDHEEPQELVESRTLEKEKEILEEKRIATQAFIEKHMPESERKRKREISEPDPGHTVKMSKAVCNEESKSSSVNESVDMDLSDSENTEAVELPTVKPSEIDVPSNKSSQEPEIPSSSNVTTEMKNRAIPKPLKPDYEEPTSSSEPTSMVGSQSEKSFEAAIPETIPEKIAELRKNYAELRKKLRKKQFIDHQTTVRSKCLTPDNFAEHAVLKRYVKGDPSSKLYIKNLNHKEVQEKDLKDLFRPYLEFYGRDEQDNVPELQIKLMTRGQMKGQAFITLPNVEASEVALSDLHGYVLHGKPMAIMFAKSK
ncbi:RNA-binding region-containing protein 3-like [Bolinopsis microptera]|uniref:RNA-binding region-containing protein 3-like n=1 Tax=Bolinopsis microptera TaxID=2820187 RepID=UPI003079D125